MKKLATIFAIIAVFCLGMSVFSAKYSVARVEKEIDNIGKITYDDACKRELDKIVSHYDALDKNQKLPQKVSNIDKLAQAKADYAYLLIKDASLSAKRKDVEGYSDKEITEKVENTKKTVEEWFTKKQYKQIENYALLEELESEYLTTSDSGSGSGDGGSVDIQLCP